MSPNGIFRHMEQKHVLILFLNREKKRSCNRGLCSFTACNLESVGTELLAGISLALLVTEATFTRSGQ